jgi:Zn-dependent protease with chaperone function
MRPASQKWLRANCAFLFLLFLAFPSFCQDNYDYFVENKLKEKKAREVLKSNLEKQLASISEDYNRTIEKDIIEKYEKRTESLLLRVEGGHFLYGTDFNAYVEKIASEIFRANPQLPKNEINLMVSRYVSPNAACFGEGTIMINLGLLGRVRSEAELAFVISHEIAHYMLNHVNQNIKKNVLLVNDSDLKKQVRKISREDYGVNSKLTELLKEIIYDQSRYTRSQESQADSLGFIYLAKSSYATFGAVSCLNMLDSVDFDKFKSEIAFKENFDSEKYPFKNRWLEEEENLFGSGEKFTFGIIADSLKSHPDCQDRISILSEDSSKLLINIQNLYLQPKTAFESLSKSADLEAVYSDFYFQRYGRSLYNALQLLERDSTNAYLYGIVGASFAKIYEAQENHELGKYLPMPSEEIQSESYKKLLVFVRNLRLKELASLNFHYMDSKPAIYLDNEFFLYATAIAIKQFGNYNAYQSYKELYIQSFPNGNFISQFK